MTDIDVLLSASLKRLAPAGDAAGVAEAIRARVEAGDTGTPATSSGFGRRGVRRWLPWLGLVVVVGHVGGAVGVAGLAGIPAVQVAVVGTATAPDDRASASACPGEAVAQTVPTDDVPIGLPCSLPPSDSPTPTPTATPRPDPDPIPEPAPAPEAPDTAGPSLSNASANPTEISMQGFPECGSTLSTVSVVATDPSGVVSGQATWSEGSAQLAASGSTWSFPFSEDTVGSVDTDYAITLTLVDGVGNVSRATTTVTVFYCLL